MVQKRPLQILIVLTVAMAVLLSLKLYYVATDPRGALFWNADNAYIFIGMRDRGYRVSYLGYVIEQVREIFPFGASAPSDEHFSVLVLHVMPDSVQQYSINDFWLGSDPTPFQGALYAGNLLDKKGLLKWSGDHFQPATQDEASGVRRALNGGQIPPGPSYDNVEGWSKRTAGGHVISDSPTGPIEKDDRVTIDLRGKPMTFVMNSGFISRHAYIDLIRSGSAPKRIWQLTDRRIGKAEYEQIFGRQ